MLWVRILVGATPIPTRPPGSDACGWARLQGTGRRASSRKKRMHMDLFVDGRRTAAASDEQTTMDELLNSVRRDNTRTHRAIAGLMCDGVDVTDEDAAGVLRDRAAKYSRIDVTTEASVSLVRQALQAAVEELEATDEQRGEVVRLFNQGKTNAAIEKLGACLRRWLMVNDTIGRSLTLAESICPSLRGDASVSLAALEPVRAKLTEIKASILAQDFVSVADILEYEFGEVARSWRELTEVIVGRVTEGE